MSSKLQKFAMYVQSRTKILHPNRKLNSVLWSYMGIYHHILQLKSDYHSQNAYRNLLIELFSSTAGAEFLSLTVQPGSKIHIHDWNFIASSQSKYMTKLQNFAHCIMSLSLLGDNFQSWQSISRKVVQFFLWCNVSIFVILPVLYLTYTVSLFFCGSY